MKYIQDRRSTFRSRLVSHTRPSSAQESRPAIDGLDPTSFKYKAYKLLATDLTTLIRPALKQTFDLINHHNVEAVNDAKNILSIKELELGFKSNQACKTLSDKHISHKASDESIIINNHMRAPNAKNILYIPNTQNRDEITQSGRLNKLQYAFNVYTSVTLQKGIGKYSRIIFDCIIIENSESTGDIALNIEWLRSLLEFKHIAVIVIGGSINNKNVDLFSTSSCSLLSDNISQTTLLSFVKNKVEQKVKQEQLIQEKAADFQLSQHLNIGKSKDSKFKLDFEKILCGHFSDVDFKRSGASTLLHLTEKTFSRRLQEYYSSNFNDLLKRYRLNHARQLILNGQSVTKAAYDSGFSTPSYFSQCFKREYGYVPSKIVNKLK